MAGSSLVAAAFSIANIIGPLTFQAKDAPEYVFVPNASSWHWQNTNHNRYIPAKITILAVNAGAIVVSTSLRVLYGMRNARAARTGGPARSRMEAKLAGRHGEEGDVHEDVSFRYVY